VFHKTSETLTWRISLAALIALVILAVLATSPLGQTNNATADSGWQHFSGPPASILSLDVSSSGAILAGTNKGVFRSTDGGKTWTGETMGIGTRPVHGFVVDETNAGLISAAAWGGIYRSEDDGATWRQSGLGQMDVSALVRDDTSPAVLYAATSGGHGVFKSSDSGQTWIPALGEGQSAMPAGQLAYDASQSSLFLASRLIQGNKPGPALQVSSDGGTIWTPRTRGLPRVGVLSLAAAEGNPGTVFAGTDGSGVFKSTDGGKGWVGVSSGLPAGARIISLQIHPLAPNVLVAATDRGVFKSENAGGFWVPLEGGLNSKGVTALAIARTSDGAVYASTWHDGIYKTTKLQVQPPAPVATAQPEATGTPIPGPKEPLPTDPIASFQSSESVWYFSEAGHSLSHGFLSFWLTHGGVEQFGMPITEEFVENGTTVQYFERALMEYHPASGDQPERIVLGLLGRMATADKYFVNIFYIPTTGDQIFFPETGHSLMHGFLRYWRSNGGIERFGLPISEELQENGKVVQYFERARLEFNADKQGADQEISVGLLGREVLQQRGWLPE
jgi:photosystem II stability/assembly factor-like uncharacterized protein